MKSPAVVGVDTGGTFTDFIVLDADGHITVRKLSSTPGDPSQSVLAGIREAQADGLLANGFSVVHGTTVATNALLQRRGAATALITTKGFRDVLAIGRQARTRLYTFAPAKPLPLLPRDRCFELSERLDWRGQVVTPLEEAQVASLLDELSAQGIQSLAVCFLFAYLNPVHERLVERLALARGFDVSLSCDIAPEPREYERASTTAANAFVAPLMQHYLTNLQTQVALLHASRLRVMQSNGGALSAPEAARRAIATALSGPAGGIVAAARVGEQAGFPDLLTFDMGGTSTDVALIVNGQCPVVTNGALGDLPLRTPLLDIHTVGAGGGSLARVDSAGGLRVGPESAGADPGPVAYGRGDVLTVTDANVMLGRLPADVRLGGRVPLNGQRVRERFAEFARGLNLTPEQAAQGILTVVDVTMTRALRHVSLERGHDPARLALLAFGGAGGLHACALADALQMQTILIPRYSGAFSALGLALAQTRREYAHALPPTRLPRVSPSEQNSAATPDLQTRQDASALTNSTDINRPLQALSTLLSDFWNGLRGQATEDMTREGLNAGGWQEQTLLDVRYVGQSFELRVPVAVGSSSILPSVPATASDAPAGISKNTGQHSTSRVSTSGLLTPVSASEDSEAITPYALEQVADAFHKLHQQRFGYADEREPVEVTGIRLVAVEKDAALQIVPSALSAAQHDQRQPAANSLNVGEGQLSPAAPVASRKVHIGAGWQDTPVYTRSLLMPGQSFDGPALVMQEDATTYIAPGWHTKVDAAGNLVLHRGDAQGRQTDL